MEGRREDCNTSLCFTPVHAQVHEHVHVKTACGYACTCCVHVHVKTVCGYILVDTHTGSSHPRKTSAAPQCSAHE